MALLVVEVGEDATDDVNMINTWPRMVVASSRGSAAAHNRMQSTYILYRLYQALAHARNGLNKFARRAIKHARSSRTAVDFGCLRANQELVSSLSSLWIRNISGDNAVCDTVLIRCIYSHEFAYKMRKKYANISVVCVK